MNGKVWYNLQNNIYIFFMFYTGYFSGCVVLLTGFNKKGGRDVLNFRT